MSGSADKRRKRWLYQRWQRDPSCDYCTVETRLCLPDEETGVAPDDMATTDHYVPRAKGGRDHHTNWRLACSKCNQAKEDQWPEIWLGEVDTTWIPTDIDAPSALALALRAMGATSTT